MKLTCKNPEKIIQIVLYDLEDDDGVQICAHLPDRDGATCIGTLRTSGPDNKIGLSLETGLDEEYFHTSPVNSQIRAAI